MRSDLPAERLLIKAAESRGFVGALIVLLLLYLGLGAVALTLSKFIEPDMAWMVVSVPGFFATMLVQPVARALSDRNIRSQCANRGHLIEESILGDGSVQIRCQRCDFTT